MSNAFVPLTLVSENNSGIATFELKVLPQAQAKPVFEALPHPVPPPQPAQAAQPAAAHANCGQPVVSVQKNGDVISGIRIQCPCGQVIQLDCRY